MKVKPKFIQKVLGTEADKGEKEKDALARMPKPSEWSVCTFQSIDLMLDGPDVFHSCM